MPYFITIRDERKPRVESSSKIGKKTNTNLSIALKLSLNLLIVAITAISLSPQVAAKQDDNHDRQKHGNDRNQERARDHFSKQQTKDKLHLAQNNNQEFSRTYYSTNRSNPNNNSRYSATINRWDYNLDNRRRYQTYTRYRNNWNEQRNYLHSNLNRFDRLSQLNSQQQQQLDAQMRNAYISYHNNNYSSPTNWSNYSEPQFLDYLQNNKPSLVQGILSAIGLGSNGNYLYSSNWSDERQKLAQNMNSIHQLAVSGRINPTQEQQLINQLNTQYRVYNHNQNNSSISWSQYSDPKFVDYLNSNQPSLLSTIRDYLVR